MHAHAGRVAQECLPIACEKTLIIERVATLVQNREDRFQNFLARTHSQPYVAGAKLRGERMRRDVEPAAIVIEADRRKQVMAELPPRAIAKHETIEWVRQQCNV